MNALHRDVSIRKKKPNSIESSIMYFKFNIQFIKDLSHLDKYFSRIWWSLGNQLILGFSSAKQILFLSFPIFSRTHRYSQAPLIFLCLLSCTTKMCNSYLGLGHGLHGSLAKSGWYLQVTLCLCAHHCLPRFINIL